MNYEDDPDRERIVVQALTAKTLSEVELASEALRQWVTTPQV